MRDVSSFRKALWCGAAATALLFALYVVAFLIIGGFRALGRERRTVVAATPSAAAGDDAVVATVELSTITKGAVARVYRQLLAPYTRGSGPGTDLIALKSLGLEVVALQHLVDREVALDEARRLQIDMTLADVRARLATMPALQENGRYIGEARALQRLARYLPSLPLEAVLEEFRRDLVIERLEEHVTRGTSGPKRLQAYKAFVERARSLTRVTVNSAILSQIVREAR